VTTKFVGSKEMESSTSMSQLEERLLKLRCPEDQVKSPQIEMVKPKMNMEQLCATESQESVVQVEDFDANAMKTMLAFIYGNEFEYEEEVLQSAATNLMVLAPVDGDDDPELVDPSTHYWQRVVISIMHKPFLRVSSGKA
jgi:hypothetical protein